MYFSSPALPAQQTLEQNLTAKWLHKQKPLGTSSTNKKQVALSANVLK
jgi:hypothetical protein